ncbi:very-long-chain 3-oxoacyl-CoA reductase-like [Loxodonta africana]|uniref:very-long-chain 3-oxoacyl-CoA reductase-like n=1 Tax=Elephas maximus indicus TaxID=99487 RepID=UPI0021164BCB|nr:very-long-chain 3-oxoacyl-CoA reductase-like [Elephas maximus indicus]
MVAWWDALGVLGALTAAWLMLRAVWGAGRAVYVYLLPSVRRDAAWLRAHGAWAAVTGATDGIGKAYAHELAKRGLNIVLISRNLNKLEQEAKEIERLHGTLTRVIQADFTGGLEIYGAIEEGLKGLEIGVLVNNVGMLYDEGFWKMLDVEDPAKRLSDIVNCNMMSVLQMTRIILPQMVSRRRGIIINVSSLSESRPNPFLAVYSATKVFVRNFSLAVAAEYLSEGVIVQTVSPAVVSTNMNRRLQTGLLVESPEDWARQAVHTLGLSSHTSGCLSHAVQSFLLSLVPTWLTCSRWGVKLMPLLVAWLSGKKKAVERE